MTQRAKYGQGLLGQWKDSGLSQAEFCRRRGLKPMTFSWWKRKLSANGNAAPRSRSRGNRLSALSGKGGFAEVRLAAAACHRTYEVVLSRGRLIRLPGDFDAKTVTRLISAVEAAC